MQQSQPQRGRLVSAFKNDYGTQNQKRTGNGPSSQYSRGGPKKKVTFRKKPFGNTHFNPTEKNSDNSPSVKGKGIRKYFPNKTLINKKKNEMNNQQNDIENIEFSFKNSQSDKNIMVDNENNSNIVNFNQNNIVDKETREQRFNLNPFGDKYFEMKKQREHLRKMYIKKGLIDDPEKQRRLEDAIPFVGECQDMCPEFERYEREYQKNLDKFEIDEQLSTNDVSRVDHVRAVKRYQRSDAGKEQPLPCDVRPPPILKKTLNYLVNEIIMKHGIEASHAFVRDRTRSIRQDFSLQNIRDKSAVDIHERIARYHILCLHQLCEKKGFSVQQEKEQLFKVLQSLQEFYDEGREKNIQYPNEPEFRAYYIIFHIYDNYIIRKAELYPKEVFFNPLVQMALDFQSLIKSGSNREGGSLSLYSRIFKKIFSPETPYLMACLLEIHFNTIRKNALTAMNYAVKFKDNVLPPYPAEKLKDLLGFETVEDLIDVVRSYSIEIEEQNNNYSIIFDKKKRLKEPEVSLSQKRTERLESKRINKSDKAIINGGINDGDDEIQSMITFSQPNINNISGTTNLTGMSNSNSVVGFSFNNNDNTMNDVNMDSNDSIHQETPMYQNTTSSGLFSFGNNTNQQPKPSVPFSFKTSQTNNNLNSQELPKSSTISFSNNTIKNTTLLNEKPTTKPSSDELSTTNQKPSSFSFNFNDKPSSSDNNKSTLFNKSFLPNKESTSITKNTGQNITLDFTKPSVNVDNKINNNVFKIGGDNININKTKIDLSSNKNELLSKNNNEEKINININKTFNIIPQEINPMDSILTKERIKKENQLKFIENEQKRINLMQNLSLHSHNIGIRPKPKLDEIIIKNMENKKLIEEQSKQLYNDFIENSTKGIINKTIQEEYLKESIYSDIISNLTKDIIKEEIKEKIKEDTLFNNYYNALDICTNDIMKSVVHDEFNSILKSVYDQLLEEQKYKNLILKKLQLKKQKKYFDERMKYEKVKYLFSKWNHIVKLRINERKIKEENLKMKKLEFDNTIKFMEIGPSLNHQNVKKNKEFVFKKEQNIVDTNKYNKYNKYNDENANLYYVDYDYEEENDQKLYNFKRYQININDIATNFIKKQYLEDIDDSIIYLKIMTSLPNDSKGINLWLNSQLNIGSMNNNIINISQENDDDYDINEHIHFSQNSLKDQKKLSVLIQNIPYSKSNNQMEWNNEINYNDNYINDEESESYIETESINDISNDNEHYASAIIFQLSIYYHLQDSNPEEIASYWDNERKRLEYLLHRIRNPSNIPLIILYWKTSNLNNKQYIQDAKYYLRLNQFYDENHVHNYQFLSIPYNYKDIINNSNYYNKNNNTINNNNNNNNNNSIDGIDNLDNITNDNNKIEKLNLGITWLIEKCHLYSLSSNVIKEIIYNNFYSVFSMVILKHIENEIPFGIFTIENASWLKDTCNTIIKSYNNILSAIIEFLYSSQVQYITVKKEKNENTNYKINGNNNNNNNNSDWIEYEDSSTEELYNSSVSASTLSELPQWLKIYDTIQRKIYESELPELTLDHPLSHNQIQTEQNLIEIFVRYIKSIKFFKSRQQKQIIIKEIKKIIQNYLFNSDQCKFPYYSIFKLIINHSLNNLQNSISDYEIYFIKYNITKNTEEISFFEELLENYKDSIYDILNQWSNTTLTQIEKAYFNEQNKRTRNSIEDTWHEISKKYQRTGSNYVIKTNSSINEPEKKKKLTNTNDIKIEKKLLKDLINNVKKEFPFLKTN